MAVITLATLGQSHTNASTASNGATLQADRSRNFVVVIDSTGAPGSSMTVAIQVSADGTTWVPANYVQLSQVDVQLPVFKGDPFAPSTASITVTGPGHLVYRTLDFTGPYVRTVTSAPSGSPSVTTTVSSIVAS